MAIEQIPEPTKEDASVADWYKIIRRTIFQGGGFIKIRLRNLNTPAAPLVAKGSRFEINGTFFAVTEDAAIDGLTEAMNEKWIFIYARFIADDDTNSDPDDEEENGAVSQGAGDEIKPECVFEYDATMPVYDEIKCAWYNGNNRAIAKMYKRDDGFWGKVVLEDYESMYANNYSVIPTSDGVKFEDGNDSKIGTPTGLFYYAKSGVYRYELEGARGGRGGIGAGGGIPNTPGEGDKKKGAFVLTEDAEIILQQGEGGGDGGAGESVGSFGPNIVRSGGGSGANGGSSNIRVSGQFTIVAQGTRGTAGSNADGSGGTNGTGGAAPAFPPAARQLSSSHPCYEEIQGFVPGNAAGSISYNVLYSEPNIAKGGAGGGTNTARRGKALLFKLWENLEEK